MYACNCILGNVFGVKRVGEFCERNGVVLLLLVWTITRRQTEYESLLLILAV